MTDIEWTDTTWNPLAGCTAVSPGCTNCYAARMAGRLQAMGQKKYAGTTRKSGRRRVWTGKVNFDAKALALPETWKKPRRVFVNSMSDLFHESVSDDVIERIWRVMAATPRHTYQVLTKRAERLPALTKRLGAPSNVWLGVSVENASVAWRMDELKRATCAVRFISFEPLIGSVGAVNLDKIHWAIVGGESGPHARPMDETWADEIHAACKKSGTAFFFKQWGGVRKKQTGRTYKNKTWDEYPDEVYAAV